MKRIAVLGSTGSIGTQTLEIVRTNKDIKITALAAGNNIELLEKQIREFKPSIAAVWNEERLRIWMWRSYPGWTDCLPLHLGKIHRLL